MLTISIYAGAWWLLTVLSPVWLVLGLLVGAVRRRSFILLRLLAFAWFYFGFELIALVLIATVFLTRRNHGARVESLYRLQAWWASLNLRAAQGLLRLTIEVTGADLALPGPVVLLIRHASILDTLLPCALIQRPHGFRVRYILKQELLFDPCIDIVGHALPNYFVDRDGNRSRELGAIRSLVRNLGTDGVLIFPEGTRFSAKKREIALERLVLERSELAESARAMTCVLPPKPGGVLVLLDALPNADCVFVAHSGLETFAKIKDVLTGELVGSTVRLHLWRVDAHEVPRTPQERVRWLYAEWEKMNELVAFDVESR